MGIFNDEKSKLNTENKNQNKQCFDLEDSAKIYLLTMNKKRMAMFRISVYLKEKIMPELLQNAVNSTIKRFPTFATKIEKNIFDYYLVENNQKIEIQEDKKTKYRQLETFDIKKQCFRVLYWNNSISIEIFHSIADGTGAFEFLKVLVTEYLKLKGIDCKVEDELIDINTTPEIEEFENAFNKVPYNKGKYKLSDKKAIQMKGKMLPKYISYNVTFNMDTNQLKTISEKNNSTVTVFLLALMFIACKKASDKSRGYISIQVPINLRKYYETKTVKNFSMYCIIRLSLNEINDIASIIDKIKQQMKEKTSQQSMEKMVTHIKKISNIIKYVPLFIKKPIAQIGTLLYGERIYTNTLSNIGILKLPAEISENIEKLCSETFAQDINRASCSVITFNNTTTFTINKRTDNPTFEKEIKELLEKEGIKITIQDQ